MARLALGLTAAAALLGGCSTYSSETEPRVIRRPDLTPLPPARAVGEPEMRVRLAAKQTKAVIGGPHEVSVSPVGDRSQTRVIATPVEFVLSAGSWTATDGRKRTMSIPRLGSRRDDALVVRAVGPAAMTFGPSSYPGEFRLAPRRDPAGDGVPEFDVIEFVPLEQYLPGVVSKELISTWSLEAFRAQVVAARTYAMQERARSMGEGATFDVEASEQDQAYGGSTANPTAIKAVNDTRGQVLKWNGTVLRSYYSSCCGGRAGSARDTWPISKGFEFNLAAPIQGVKRDPACPCEFSGRYRWTVVRERQDLIDRLAAYGEQTNLAVRGIRSLSKVVVATQNDTGRPASYRVFDAAGKWYPLSAEQLRLACNTVAPGRAPVDAKTRVFSGDLAFTFTGDSVRIDGRGFGHGVGLCQFGAEGMSRKGRGFMDILRYYYPGAVLERAY